MLNFLRIRWLLSSKTLSPSIYMFSMLVAQMLRSFRTDRQRRKTFRLFEVGFGVVLGYSGLFQFFLTFSSLFYLVAVCSGVVTSFTKDVHRALYDECRGTVFIFRDNGAVSESDLSVVRIHLQGSGKHIFANSLINSFHHF